MKHTVIPSVNLYVLNDNKVMLSRRSNTGWMDGYLCAPGGHVEVGETPKQAMVREIREELGTEVDPNDLTMVCVAARNTKPSEYVAYEFAIINKNYTFTNNEPEKCSELTWVDVNHLPEDVIEDFRIIIQRSVIGSENYLELGY